MSEELIRGKVHKTTFPAVEVLYHGPRRPLEARLAARYLSDCLECCIIQFRGAIRVAEVLGQFSGPFNRAWDAEFHSLSARVENFRALGYEVVGWDETVAAWLRLNGG